MAEIVCIAFEDIGTADKALIELQLLRQDEVLDLPDCCVLRRNEAGDVCLKQGIDLVGGGVVGGGVLGTACGSVVGWLFTDPSVGMLIGTGVGAAMGAVSAALSDYGIDDQFIEATAGSVRPGGSALLLLLRGARLPELLARLKDFHPVVLHASSSGSQARNVRRREDGDSSAAD